ncbi:MAG: acetyl-CoA carboxylase biotin carboxyl carrier protein subunit [Nitrososphaeraceae archaeon]
MDFKIEDNEDMIKGDLLRNYGSGNILLNIDNNDYHLQLLKSKSNEFEFMLDNVFHHVKILKSDGTSYTLLVDGSIVHIKKHSKLTEIIEKSLQSKGNINQANNVSSQIPGRVVKIPVKQGDEVKEGDSILVLESMKMQVSIKAHKSGIIKSIKVEEGKSISRNDVVATIE